MTLTDVLQTRREYAQILELKNALIIDNPSGSGAVEVSGTTNAFIDLKSPNSDDFDMRLGTNGAGGYISTSGNTNILLSPGGSGNVRIENIKTYANNAAAIAGGLSVNSVYQTATGELRIVV